MNLRAFVSSLGHPAYTGPARNPGFVVANIVVASLLAVVADWAVPLSGSVVVGVALGLLAVRGYAVPGTPSLRRFVGRYVDTPEANRPPTDEAGQRLRRAGVLKQRGDQLTMTDDFATTWREWVATVGPRRMDDRLLATALGVPTDVIDLRWQEGGRVLVAWVGEEPIGAWLSRAALVADTASIAVLRSSPEWSVSSGTPRLRGPILPTLRRTLDCCPACDGQLRHERAASRLHDDHETLVVTCEGCDARLFEAGFDAGSPLVTGDTSTSVVGR